MLVTGSISRMRGEFSFAMNLMEDARIAFAKTPGGRLRILDKQLDKLVRQFKKVQPEFVSRYRNARVIANVAASRAGTPSAPAPAPAPALAGKA